MKKLIAFLAAMLVAVFAFAGCGCNAEKEMVSEASKIVTDAVNEAETMMSEDTNGMVTDGDGIIGNEDEENKEDNKTSDISEHDATSAIDNTVIPDSLM